MSWYRASVISSAFHFEHTIEPIHHKIHTYTSSGTDKTCHCWISRLQRGRVSNFSRPEAELKSIVVGGKCIVLEMKSILA